MGVLPTPRVSLSPPFVETGLDFAGPVTLRRGHTRKPVYDKCYMCIFVCLSTKGVHLELCPDLSTDSFMATLCCFIARRGCPCEIYSDSGTNFVGARHELDELYNFLQSQDTIESLEHFFTNRTIHWSHTPSRAPHFGGLREATVKAAKTHLHKVLATQRLTYEEYATILAEIEAILNNRPLYPLSSQSEYGVDALTPAHLLVGHALKSLPQPPTSVIQQHTSTK